MVIGLFGYIVNGFYYWGYRLADCLFPSDTQESTIELNPI